MVAVLAWSTSLTIASALAATQTSMSTWADLAARAGAPAPRLFDETERLHGADAPRVRLWHDAAAWHPFANQVWLLLEAARIPHCRAVVPLSQYRRPGPRDDARLAAFSDALPGANPDGVPYVQLATAAGGWGPPLRERSAVALLRALDREFPEHGLLPRAPRRRALCDELLARYADLQKALYGVLGGKSTAAAREAYAARMDAWNARYARDLDLALGSALCPDDGGEAPVPRDAPFLLGSLGAIDALLLPLLERCEANVPHAVVGTGRSKLALGRWPALARLLAAARRDDCPIHALLGDPTTTLGVRLAVTGAVGRQPLPPPPPPDAAAAAAAASAPAARLDAAARLCANGAACAGFSRRPEFFERRRPGRRCARQASRRRARARAGPAGTRPRGKRRRAPRPSRPSTTRSERRRPRCSTTASRSGARPRASSRPAARTARAPRRRRSSSSPRTRARGAASRGRLREGPGRDECPLGATRHGPRAGGGVPRAPPARRRGPRRVLRDA